MAGEKLLSETACRGAKPTEKVYYLNDGGGLRLRCRPDGSRAWIYRYRLNGKERAVGLGPYPQIHLGIARAKASDTRKLVSEGKDPSLEKKQNKAARIAQETQTFGAIAREWVNHNKASWSANHLERNEGLIRRYLIPDLDRLPIQEIKENYLFSVLKPVYDKGRVESARRTRAIAGQIFSFGRATHRCTHNPAKDMADSPYFKKVPVNHLKALPQQDVPALVVELNKIGTDQRLKPPTVCALLLTLYTGLRDHSVRGATWQEIDIENKIWSVPGERMKSGRIHQVPLPIQAIAALRCLQPITYRSPDSFVFSANTKAGYIAENTLRLALHRLGHKVTVHGLRSLITDVLNENGFNADAVEKQLDHLEQNEVRRAYLRSNFMVERKRMMQWFADWCEGKAEGGVINNVVSMQGRR